jgi:hypothetical protein
VSMTVQDFRRLLQGRLHFGWPFRAWGLSVQVHAIPRASGGPGPSVVVVARLEVPHRDTGEVGPLMFEKEVSERMLAQWVPDDALDWLRREVLLPFLSHELAESMLVDGARVMDPHRPRVPVPLEPRAGHMLGTSVVVDDPFTPEPA